MIDMCPSPRGSTWDISQGTGEPSRMTTDPVEAPLGLSTLALCLGVRAKAAGLLGPVDSILPLSCQPSAKVRGVPGGGVRLAHLPLPCLGTHTQEQE